MPYTNPNELNFLNDVEVNDPLFPLEGGNLLFWDETVEKWVNVSIQDLGIPDINYAGESYTPVWRSANDDLEYDGGVTGLAIRYGVGGNNGIVFFSINISMADVTDFGTGDYTITLPFEALENSLVVGGELFDDSNGHIYPVALRLTASTDIAQILYIGSSSRYEPLDHNSPHTLVEDDSMNFHGWYRVALSA